MNVLNKYDMNSYGFAHLVLRRLNKTCPHSFTHLKDLERLDANTAVILSHSIFMLNDHISLLTARNITLNTKYKLQKYQK